MSGDDKYLERPCYQRWLSRNDQGWNNSLRELQIAAMQVMARCFYISNRSSGPDVPESPQESFRVRIFQALFQKMTHPSDTVLMKAGEECLELFLMGTKQSSEYEIPRDEIHKELRPTLMEISDFERLTYVVVERLVVLSRLFHNTFNQKLCDTMMAHLKTALKKLSAESQSSPGSPLNADLIKMCAAICELFPVVQ